MTERAVVLAGILQDQLRSGAPRETLLWTLGLIRSEVMAGDAPGPVPEAAVSGASLNRQAAAGHGPLPPVATSPRAADGLRPGPAPEVNQVLGVAAASLNDALREGRPEVGELLVPEGASDLRRAIGVNDRFRLIEGLFGGDAAAFDAMVRDLDGRDGHAAAEALLGAVGVRRGWDMEGPLPGLLRQLLSRRFSAM